MLEELFIKLGYNRNNGLFILEESEEEIIQIFPSRISRVLTEVIKPYAVFSLDASYEANNHVKPFNNPLILFYDNPSIEEYHLIPKHSFNLSRSPIIIVNRNNTIEIFNGFDFESPQRDWLKSIDVDDSLLNINNLRSGKGWKEIYNKYFQKTKTVDRYLLSNITDARRILIAKESNFKSGNLSPEVANRLIGRLLFIRYLIDRNVRFVDQDLLTGNSKSERQEALNNLLLDHSKTYDFFDYISQKFEGDLFPLFYENEGLHFYERDTVLQENLEVLHYLLTSSNMFKGGTIKGYTVQQSLFNVYDFEIIPVELISNIYESFLGNTAFSKGGEIVTKLSKQKEVKAFYTPPFVVDYVLSQTVKPHLMRSNNTDCKILDPSCGSGIFLVESLRQIIDKEIKLKFDSSNNPKELVSNERLWELLENNIYGIDIDPNAIEVTIFSLYITLLDYKTHPREIENFAFKPLKGKNLFGGQGADFFNTENLFNQLFQHQIKLDFIIGNPPWGRVKKSDYVAYISKRAKEEFSHSSKKAVKLSIGNKEISQAFMVRAGDFIQENSDTKICFIVTGKNVYNSDLNALTWRKYLLNNYTIHQFFDLFGVNNKIAGGKQIFDNANQPPAIFLYSKRNSGDSHVVKHIVARANLYYHYFKTIVIEKNDVKYVNQKLFLNDDKLWKILLHGNSLDYLFVKKIRKKGTIISEIIKEEEMYLKGGFKPKDASILTGKRKDTSEYWNYKYIEVEGQKGLRPYEVNSHKTFKEKLNSLCEEGIIKGDLKVPQLPQKSFFNGHKLLIKKGLDKYLNHRAVSAVTKDNVMFSATVAAIGFRSKNLSQEQENMLYSMSALFNSKLFIYYSFMTSSSFGAGRNRLNFNEFLEMLYIPDRDLSKYSRKLHGLLKDNWGSENFQEARELEFLIEEKINKIFDVTPLEKELINYALEVNLPIMKRADRTSAELPPIFKEVRETDIDVLEKYTQIFTDHFADRFDTGKEMFCIDAYINPDFIALHFKISAPRSNRLVFTFDTELHAAIKHLGNLGINEVSTRLFTQQDIRGFNEKSFYVIKPNIIKNWHQAMAHMDLIEFIEAIASSEIKNTRKQMN